jgi:hypothetical protein
MLTEITYLGDGAMVAQRPLEPLIGVRVPVSQHSTSYKDRHIVQGEVQVFIDD